MKTIPFIPLAALACISTITRSLGTGPLQDGLSQMATMFRRRLALPLFLFCAVLLARPCIATPGEWDFTGSLNTARSGHAAALLSDGRVLVAAGSNSSDLKSAELYDPATGNWTFTGSLSFAREIPTATRLSDGRVLLAGGTIIAGGGLPSADLYNPATGTWTGTGLLNNGRYYHTATLLADGRVLVAAGIGPASARLASAELYDPAAGHWTFTGSLSIGRDNGTATLLQDGRVLFAGGYNSGALAGAELYDPATGTWSLTGSLNTARYFHSATLLSDGRVLVVGGYNDGTLDSAELYDPAAGNWTVTGSLQAGGQLRQTATLLPDGRVLIAGGQGSLSNFGIDNAEVYNPATGRWSVTGSLNNPRTFHTATLLPNGQVLAAGGQDDSALASAELYDPGITAASRVSGRGSIDGQGDQASFTVRAIQSGDRPSGSLSFSDPTAGISITKARIRTLTFNGKSADLGGNARLGDGTRVTYNVSVTDNSSDGTSDTFSISLSNGYSADGTLTSGDIRIY